MKKCTFLVKMRLCQVGKVEGDEDKDFGHYLFHVSIRREVFYARDENAVHMNLYIMQSFHEY